ncbi:MAG: hypothetical protein WAM97_17820 [Acidimicrobiales bacterium]|jgi:hypothetical protein
MSHHDRSKENRVPIIAALVAILAVSTFIARKKGYSIGVNTIVRCSKGHLFTTIWIPGGSLKALRLGWKRFQYCPVGKHWSMVTPVKDSDLTDEQKRFAKEHHDIRIP